MDETPVSYSGIPNEPVAKSRHPIVTVLGIVGFLVLAVAANGTAFYFGTKASNAKTSPSAIPQQNQLQNTPTEITYTDTTIPISFQYATLLGTPVLTKATDSTIGATKEGENWWQIQFDERDLVPGYIEIHGATPGFVPNSWGNALPLWNTSPIKAGDENSARSALEKLGYTVISIKPSDPVAGYQAWSTICKDDTCFLYWHELLPQTETYASIQIGSVIATFPKDESIQTTAENMIKSLEQEGDANPMKPYVDRATAIANSLISVTPESMTPEVNESEVPVQE